MQKTPHSLLDQLLTPRPGNAFYYWDSQGRDYQSITYQDLYQNAHLLAQELREAGLSHHSVMVVFPQGLEFVQVVLACLLADVVFIPLHQIRTKSDISLLQSMAGSSMTPWVLSPHSLGEFAENEGRIGSYYLENLTPYEGRVESIKDTCFLQYSSGTTHKPKGVMISHENLQACLSKMIDTMKITPQDHGCVWLPAYQDLGIIGGVFLPLYAGFPLTLMSPRTFILNPLKWLEVMTEQEVTITAAPNFAYDLCVDRLKENQDYGFDLKQLRIALNGAELVKLRTIERFSEAFQPYHFNPHSFYPAYGLTEATLMVSANHPMDPIRKKAIPTLASHEIISCGKPMDDITVRIVRDECPVGPLEVGEIWISGSTVACGYWNDYQSTEDKFNQKLTHSSLDKEVYVKSGDLGFMDHDGFLYVLGRYGDQIHIDGKTYLSEYLEDMVLEKFHQDATYKTAAFTNQDQELIILCEASPHYERLYPLMGTVAQALYDTFALSQVTIAFVKRGQIPVTTNGKIKRHAAQVLYHYGVIETIMVKTFTMAPKISSPSEGSLTFTWQPEGH